MLAIVSFPTFEETEANLDKLTPSERDDFRTAEDRWRQWEANKLQSPSQLPELGGYGPLKLTWDQEGEGLEGHTVIRHGDQEVWRELVLYEAYERFEEILQVLKARYGSRLVDVEPTPRSHLYLWGDRLDAPERTDGARRRLRENLDRFIWKQGDVKMSLCASCVHKHLGLATCDAYPVGIPIEFLNGSQDHTVSAPGDGGIRYEKVV